MMNKMGVNCKTHYQVRGGKRTSLISVTQIPDELKCQLFRFCCAIFENLFYLLELFMALIRMIDYVVLCILKTL